MEYVKNIDGSVNIKINDITIILSPIQKVLDEGTDSIIESVNNDHIELINLFETNKTALEKYVDYLGNNPNIPFNLSEILLIINN
jgi:hypothetical protein